MKEKNDVQEIKSDTFYVKQPQTSLRLKFGYLHLSEKADEVFLAVFENTDALIPLVYWWNEDDADAKKESRNLITEFIGEVYMSLYIKCKFIEPTDKPLWEEAQLADSIITPEWRDIVENINRENYGSRKK